MRGKCRLASFLACLSQLYIRLVSILYHSKFTYSPKKSAFYGFRKYVIAILVLQNESELSWPSEVIWNSWDDLRSVPLLGAIGEGIGDVPRQN